MSSDNVIDLRRKAQGRKPPPTQRPLWSAPRGPEPRRPMPLRARRRRVRALIAFLILLGIAFIAWSVSYISYLPRFTIQQVSVTGASVESPQLVEQYAETILDDGSYHFLARDNIFLYPSAVIERDIVAEFPRIASAQISRPSLFSNELNVVVQERQEYARWCLSAQAGSDEGSCYSMDSTGYIFAPVASSTASGGEYIFLGGTSTSSSPVGQTFAPSHLPGLVALLTDLGQSDYQAEGVDVDSDQDFSVPILLSDASSTTFLLKASFGEDPQQLVSDLNLVLTSAPLQGNEDQIQYIDLRFGDRVYYKLNGEAEASSSTSD